MVKTPVCKWLKYRMFYATVGFRTAAAAHPKLFDTQPCLAFSGDPLCLISSCMSKVVPSGCGVEGL